MIALQCVLHLGFSLASLSSLRLSLSSIMSWLSAPDISRMFIIKYLFRR